MNILANENFPGDAVAALRARGHDVCWARTDSPGASDRSVLQRSLDALRAYFTDCARTGDAAIQVRCPEWHVLKV